MDLMSRPNHLKEIIRPKVNDPAAKVAVHDDQHPAIGRVLHGSVAHRATGGTCRGREGDSRRFALRSHAGLGWASGLRQRHHIGKWAVECQNAFVPSGCNG